MSLILPQRGRLRQAAAAASGALQADIDAGNITAAWSLRKVNEDYTGNCAKIREDNGNTTSDIGFSADYFDTSAASSFISGAGGTNGYIDTWYDQIETLTIDAIQALTAGQPLLNTSGLNSLSSFDFDGVDDDLVTPSIALLDLVSTDEATIMVACLPDGTVGQLFSTDNNWLNTKFIVLTGNWSGNAIFEFSNGTSGVGRVLAVNPSDWENNAHTVIGYRNTSDDQELLIDGVSVASGTGMTGNMAATSTGINIGNGSNGARWFGGKIVEVIVAKTDLGASVRTAWMDEIEALWGIVNDE